MKTKFITLVTAVLSLTPAQTTQTTALHTWADKYVPVVETEVRDILSGPFDWNELGLLAETAVKAAQELKGIFSGADRAKIAQVVLIEAVRAALPEPVESWIVPLVSSESVAGLIEAAFQKLFPTPPVVDAPELPLGGIQ